MDGWQNTNSGDVVGSLLQVGRAEQLVMNLGGHPKPLYPDMLTFDPAHIGFTNRTAELAELDRLWAAANSAGRLLFALLTGMPGIGKSLTALRWAHQMRGEFPGGIFVADLRGSDPTGARTPSDVLGVFLGRLGLSSGALPATEEERGAAFREITAHRRILVVLDDAATAAQVRALLPSSPTSAVLVTSRRELTVLNRRVKPIPVGPFEDGPAIQLLADSLDGVEVADAALRKLSKACGRHPMALQLIGAQLHGRSAISSYVDRVSADLLQRLESDEQRSLEAGFEFGYSMLSAKQQHAYRLLGCHPAPEFSLQAAAALWGCSAADADDLLAGLSRASVVVRAGARYRFHPLYQQHARTKPVDGDERDAALRRMVEHYHDFAMARDVVVSKRRRLSDRYRQVVPAHTGKDALGKALDELEAERETLTAMVRIAADSRLDDRAWQLCETLFPFYNDRNHSADLIEIHQIGVEAAERLGDYEALVRMHSQYGSAFFGAGDYAAAMEQFDRSHDIAVQHGNAWGEQSAVEWRGMVHERRGNLDAALECFDRSRQIVETRFEPERQRRPLALYGMHSGRVLTHVKRETEAVPRLLAAFECFAELGEPANCAKVALSLAEAKLRDHAEGMRWAQRSLELSRQARMPADQAAARELIAELSARGGDVEAALAQRREAGEILALLGNRRAQALLARGS